MQELLPLPSTLVILSLVNPTEATGTKTKTPDHTAVFCKSRYKGLPSALVNHRELVKLKCMIRECIARQIFSLPFLLQVSLHSTT